MARIVCLMPPFHGHLNPVLPLMRELLQRGEQVSCYCGADFRAKIEASGADFRAYSGGSGAEAGDFGAEGFARRIQDGNMARVTAYLLQRSEAVLPWLIDELGRERPDLLLFDSTALWGKVAATKLGLRAAASISHFILDEQQIPAAMMPSLFWQFLPQLPWVLSRRARLQRRYGEAFPAQTPLFPMRDRLNLVYTARELHPETPLIDASYRFVGPSIDPQAASQALPALPEGPGPLVYVSLGTLHAFTPAFYRICLQAFGDYPARFLFAVGPDTDIPALGPPPRHFSLQPRVPQLAVLGQAAAFISHAGLNSVHEALWQGVPLLLMPHQIEQWLNARTVSERGAGLMLEQRLHHRPLTPARLRQSLDALLQDAGYREAAGRLGKTLRATGGWHQAADELQAYLET